MVGNWIMVYLIKIFAEALQIALSGLHICQAKSEGTCPLDTQFEGLMGEDR